MTVPEEAFLTNIRVKIPDFNAEENNGRWKGISRNSEPEIDSNTGGVVNHSDMATSDQEFLEKIQTKIPEFGAEEKDGLWTWTYRCSESENEFESLQDCLIDFAATIANDADTAMGLDEED